VIRELTLDRRQAHVQLRYQEINPLSGTWNDNWSYEQVGRLTAYPDDTVLWAKAETMRNDMQARADRRNVHVILNIGGITTQIVRVQDITEFLDTTWVPKLVKATKQAATEGVDLVGARIVELTREPMRVSNTDILIVLRDLNTKINAVGDVIKQTKFTNTATQSVGSPTPKGDN